MKILPLLLILVLTALGSSCQPTKKTTKGFVILSYNVENLFDTIDTPNKTDEEYLPTANFKWNTERYTKKISDIAKVISSVQKGKFPIAVGLCEVENDIVLKDLIADKQLKKAKYSFLWKDGSDDRGIDCAFLYQPDIIKVESFETLPVINPEDEKFKTRDILYVKGLIGKETFHFFVNHWPSRRGGENETEEKRGIAATVLRGKVDMILKQDINANIIIMGDLNDEPSNESITDVLKAKSNKKIPTNGELVNLMYDEFERGEGSHVNRGDWSMLDNIIVSKNLLTKKSGLKAELNDGFIFHQPFMEFVNDKGQMSPNRTYGRNYYGGISDHFPVYMTIK